MDIEQKIALARQLRQNHGDRLLADSEVCGLMERLDKAIAMTKSIGKETGAIEICSRCETEQGGSCCGAGIENKYDEWLLLINLLLGVDIPDKRYDVRSCYFLGKKGCILKARHVICINYVCDQITSTIAPGALEMLREKEGIEIEALFLLTERIKKVIKSHGRAFAKDCAMHSRLLRQ